jgi:hypothetical protein
MTSLGLTESPRLIKEEEKRLGLMVFNHIRRRLDQLEKHTLIKGLVLKSNGYGVDE